MSSIKRRLALHWSLAVCLSAAAIWSYDVFSRSRRAASAAAENLAACQQLSSRIEALRSDTAVAGSQELQSADLTSRIEEAAKTAGIMTQESLVRVLPEPPRRLGESGYSEKPTQVFLRRVNLRQLITFLHAMGSGNSGIHVRAVRLHAPRGEEDGDLWTVEATLSQILVAPEAELSSVANRS